MQFNDITDLGGWEGYTVTEIHKTDDDCHLTLTANRNQTGTCPRCHRQEIPLHDYRWRRVRELPVFSWPTILHVERRPEYVNIVVGFFDIIHATFSRAGFNTSKSDERYFRVSRLPHRSGCLRFASSSTEFRCANML